MPLRMQDFEQIQTAATSEDEAREGLNRLVNATQQRQAAMQKKIDSAAASFYESRKILSEELDSMNEQHEQRRETARSYNRMLYGENEANTSIEQSFRRLSAKLNSENK